jgi:hypothetical protein
MCFSLPTIEIVSEQIGLIRASAIAAISQNLTIYYNTMGSDGSKEIQEICQNTSFLHCVHMKHHPRGDEIWTLQALYEYCQENNNNNNTIRVGYLDNKGSFHDNPEKSKLRIPLTQAVVESSQRLVHIVRPRLFGFALHDHAGQLFCEPLRLHHQANSSSRI